MEFKKAVYPFSMITKPIGPLCNLYCSYCFYLTKEELFPHENRRAFIMSPEILESYIKQYIYSQPEGNDELVFTWQGGEPTLLGTDYFRKVLALQKKYNPSHMIIHNSLQTNGTCLNDEMAVFLKDNNFLVGLSLDGPEKLHNRYRQDRNGLGSFNQVMKGLELLKKHDVEFNTLTVVQDDNSQHPEEVYRFLKEVGSSYLQFIPLVEPPSDTGKLRVSKRTVGPIEWGKFLVGIFQEWLKKDIGRIFIQHFDLTLGVYSGSHSSLCVHSKYCGKALAIEHNGDVFSCDHFVDPDHFLGNISETLAEVVQQDKQVIFGKNKFDALPDDCLQCKYLALCYGGCPKDRLIEGKGGKLNWLCEGFKYYYEKTYPVYSAMYQALQRGEHASSYMQYLVLPEEYTKKVSRNNICPCLSGKKFKNCHGR